MRLQRLCALLAILAPLLSACGPRTVLSSLFPLRYDVRTLMVLDDHGTRVVLTGQGRCKVVDATDSIAANFEVEHTGGGLWTRLADGALLVLPSQGCPWDLKGPRYGAVERYDVDNLKAYVATAYRFPSADDAAIVDRLTLSGPEARGAPLRLAALSFVAMNGPTPPRLDDGAAPWRDLRRWDAQRDTDGIGAGTRERLAPGGYVAAFARVWRLAPGTDCGQTGAQPLQLDESTVCLFINPCDRADRAPRRSVCGQPLGSLAVTPNADFSQMQARLDGGAGQPWTRFYRADRVAEARPGQGLGSPWRPRLCVDDLCAPPGDRRGEAVWYFPAAGLLVQMGTEFTTISLPAQDF